MKENIVKRYIDVILWALAIVWTLVAVVIAWYNLSHEINLTGWVTYYKWFIFILFFWSIPITVLFIVGGIRDLMRLFKGLNEEVLDTTDNGQIHDKS